MAKRVVLGGIVVLVAFLGLLPLCVMLAKSLTVEGEFSLNLYQALFAAERQWTLLEHTLILASLTTLVATVIGVPLGILLGKTDLPFRHAFAVLLCLPLFLPPYILAISWNALLGSSLVLQGLFGCVLVLTSAFMPVVMLLTMTFIKMVDPRLEEAGRLASGWKKVLAGITLPLLWPGILLGALVVSLLTLGEFGVPAFLRYDVFPVESFVQFSAFYNFGAATAAAMPLGVIALALLAGERFFLREKTYQLRPAGGPTLILPLGKHRNGWVLLIGLGCVILVILPLFALVTQSFSPGAYREAFSRASDSLGRSLLYAAIGASLLTLVGFFVGYLIQTKALPFWKSVDSLTVLLFALPSTVVGIGLVIFWNRPPTNFVYATPVIILIGYLVQFTALASRITVSSLAQIPPSMEEAAQAAGAGWLRRVTMITAPLAGRGLAAAWLVAYIFCLRDVGITMLVYPPGHDTLPVRIFTLMANGTPPLIATLCVILILAIMIPMGCLGIVVRPQARLP